MEDALDPALTPARPVAATEAADGESALVAASRKGSARAFNELVLRWEGPVYNLSLRMLGDPEEAAEATQETFLSAYRGLSRFRGRSRFSTWLYRIASNRCLTRLRQRPDVAEQSLDAGPVGRADALLAGEAPEAPPAVPGPATHPAPPFAPGAPFPPEAAEEMEKALEALEQSGDPNWREHVDELRSRLAEAHGRAAPTPRRWLEELEERNEELAAELLVMQERLVDVLARHGDSLTQVRPDEFVTVVLRPSPSGHPLPGRGSRAARVEDRVVSLRKAAITGFKTGEMSEGELRETALVYRY